MNYKNQDQTKKDRLNSYAKFSGVAFQMIAIVVAGAFLGIKLDEAYPNQYQLFTIIFSLLAVAISMYYVIKQVSNTSK